MTDEEIEELAYKFNMNPPFEHNWYDIFEFARAIEKLYLSKWLPIETAPKDELIDILVGERRFTDCWWDTTCEEYRTTGNANMMIRLKNATHWMPLPEAPCDAQ